MKDYKKYSYRCNGHPEALSSILTTLHNYYVFVLGTNIYTLSPFAYKYPPEYDNIQFTDIQYYGNKLTITLIFKI